MADITEGFLNSPLMTQFLDDSERKPYAPLRPAHPTSATSYRAHEEAKVLSSEETQYVGSPSTVQHTQEESRLTNTAKFEEEKQFRGPPTHHYGHPSEAQYAGGIDRGSVVNPFATRGTHAEAILPYHPNNQSRNQMYNPL